MSEIIINRARAASVTGHRVIEKEYDREKLKNTLENLTKIGYDTFLVGMALGFDTLCFQVLEEIRERTPLKIIACIPCDSQPVKFNDEQKKEYNRMLVAADERVYVSHAYDDKCMMRRNKYLVDNSSVIVSYLRRNYGGTFFTVNYAKKQKIKIIET